ncbi:transferase, mitochondrial [Canna indica]|uniref:Transferase, mitochondrial n=1 Tax=Canna indica TaxID=4628 RepID=A0AAQ3JQD6_9LILI|nr:transferase, mitochondrial [Canna indica]
MWMPYCWKCILAIDVDRYLNRFEYFNYKIWSSGPVYVFTSYLRLFPPSLPLPTPSGRQAGPLACRLESRTVVQFRGLDTVKFLQGLLTNDVCRLAAQDIPAGGSDSQTPYVPTPNLNHRNPPPLYAALVTPQGRFLYARPLPLSPPGANEKLNWSGSGPGSNDSEEPFTLFADVDAAVVDELLHCFKK